MGDTVDAVPPEEPVARHHADTSEPTTSDQPDRSARELDIGWGESPPGSDQSDGDDERLLRDRPPHWEQ